MPTDHAEADVLDTTAAGGLLIRGGVLRFAGYFGAVGLSVLSAALLTRHLGTARFGQYTTVMSLVAVVAAIADAGMSNIGTREYAVLRGEDRDALMRDLLGLRVALTLVGVLLILVFALAVGYDTPLVVGAVAAGSATVALVFQHTLSIPLTADLRLGLLTTLELARQALWVAGIVLLVAAGAGVLPLLAILLLVNLILIPPTARLVRGRISPRLALHPATWPPLLAATVVFSLATAVGTIYIYAAQILTSIVTTAHQSGVFAVSFRVFIVSASVPGLLVGATLPLLARAARDDLDRLAYALQRIFEVALVAGVGAALVMSAGADFIVSVIGGAKYRGAGPVLEIQAFAMIGSFVVAGWSYGLLSLRRHRGLLAGNALALLVSVVLTLVLASSDGARGAAIATVCGETTLAATMLLALVWRRPRYRPQIRVTIKVFAAAVGAAAASLEPSMPSLVRALVAAIVYGAIILATGALPAELAEQIPRRRPRR
ncbi:MAG TPA: polysaccharide biosynthesis C-terminal domain-containing protein [Solirubrobacteraceae bacterium]|jgi:O-antigen/teichoic acid export membrane protein|nr:polysaccharide biosynthesis C-terminal domain-containing protein [Solirubrobacteraceae bacterium]